MYIILAALVASLYFTGCTEEDGPTNGNGPTNVEVTAIDESRISVRWTRESGDASPNTIIATPVGGGAAITENIGAGLSTGIIDGLTPNVKYTIQVESSTNNLSTGVEWATATRSAKIRLWETADNTAGHFSGLVLGNPGEATSSAHSASTIGAEKLDIDLVLASDTSLLNLPYMTLQGADVDGSGIIGGRATRLGNVVNAITAGLDGDFYSTSFSDQFNLGVNFVPFPQNASDPLVILVKTADNPSHYARVEVTKQPSGLVWGEGPAPENYRYIDVVVSYQPIAGVAYAGRPVGIARGFNTPKVGGAKIMVKR